MCRAVRKPGRCGGRRRSRNRRDVGRRVGKGDVARWIYSPDTLCEMRLPGSQNVHAGCQLESRVQDGMGL